MQNELTELLQEAKQSIQQSATLSDLEELRVRYLGKKGHLTALLRSVSNMPSHERPQLGQAINLAKEDLISCLAVHEQTLQTKALADQLAREVLDITLPGRGHQVGAYHPVTRVRSRVEQLFASMGFSVAIGPEIEDEYHNFEAMNIPVHHPARATGDTFYFADGRLLRTHTSPVQIRVMHSQPLPLRVIAPGRVYRRDSDQTHTPMFHQTEGLVVDKNITFAHLKNTVMEFFSRFFEREVNLRFRPSYFPFTEPSAEVDIQREHDGAWLEVGGCGLVHPNVFVSCGIDPEEYSGFAFGLGLDRLAMLRYGITDLRVLFENDIRLLSQFV